MRCCTCSHRNESSIARFGSPVRPSVRVRVGRSSFSGSTSELTVALSPDSAISSNGAGTIGSCASSAGGSSGRCIGWIFGPDEQELEDLRASPTPRLVAVAPRPIVRPLAGSDSSVIAQLERRRRAASEAWSLEGGQAVVVGAGLPLPVPGRGDRTYPFYAHSEYLYLTDRERPGAVLAFDPGDGW